MSDVTERTGPGSVIAPGPVIDATIESFVFEITGKSRKISQFIDLMRPLGLVDVSRTGVAAIGRGSEGM